MLWRMLVLVVLALAVGAARVTAKPAGIFDSHLDQIRQDLPPGYAMRLPSQILLGGPADDEFIQRLIVRIFPSSVPPGLNVSLFTCNTGPQPCLVGSFSVDAQNSANALRELKRHEAAATPIRLTQNIQGYLLEGPKQNPSYPFSSVMWQQDSMIYKVSFLADERQNILNMAYSMANETPIRRAAVPVSSLRQKF